MKLVRNLSSLTRTQARSRFFGAYEYAKRFRLACLSLVQLSPSFFYFSQSQRGNNMLEMILYDFLLNKSSIGQFVQKLFIFFIYVFDVIYQELYIFLYSFFCLKCILNRIKCLKNQSAMTLDLTRLMVHR